MNYQPKKPKAFKRVNGKVVRTLQPRQDLNIEVEGIGGAYKPKPTDEFGYVIEPQGGSNG